MQTSRIRGNGAAPASILLLAFLLPVLTGCASFFTPPSVRIVGVDLVSVGLTSGTAEVTLEVTNQRSREMKIRGFLYRLEVRGSGGEEGWAMLADGTHPQEIVLPGDQVQEIVIPVPFEYRALGAALRSFLANGEVPYRLSGEVQVGGSRMGFTVPFSSEGILKP